MKANPAITASVMTPANAADLSHESDVVRRRWCSTAVTPIKTTRDITLCVLPSPFECRVASHKQPHVAAMTATRSELTIHRLIVGEWLGITSSWHALHRRVYPPAPLAAIPCAPVHSPRRATQWNQYRPHRSRDDAG